MCRVSVIIAAYNAENYIERAIKSFQNQTYQNYEIIVCDDFSTDKTVVKIKELMEKDKRIVLLQNKVNMKSAATRNKCLEIATGEYVAIQDADDFSHSTRLNDQIKFLDNNPEYDFVSSKMIRFDERDDVKNLEIKTLDNQQTSHKTRYIISPENKDFLIGLPYAHGPTMFRKSALISVNGYRISNETVRGQDADLFMRLHANSSRGYNLNQPLYYYFEGKEAFKRKKFKYRIHAVIIRYKGFKAMGLLPKGYIFIIKPLLVGLIPVSLLKIYKRNR